MNVTTATAFMTANKGAEIVVTLADGTAVTGTAISVNSKGVNVTVDGKVKSFGLARVEGLALPIVDGDTDGLTTREVAELFDIAAKELRVHLRALGMGVGKGRTYHMSADEVAKVRTYIDGLTVEA